MSFLTNFSKIFKAPAPARKGKARFVKVKKTKPYLQKKPLIPYKEAQLAKKQINEANKQVQEAKTRAREIILESKDEAFKIKSNASDQVRKLEKEAFLIKEKISRSEADISQQIGAFKERQKLLVVKDKQLKEDLAQVEKIKKNQLAKLESGWFNQRGSKKAYSSSSRKKINFGNCQKNKRGRRESAGRSQ